MASAYWLSATPSIVVGIALSFLIERQALPGALPVWRRHPAAYGVHAGLWLLLFALELAAFRRPWLASANALALVYLLVLINNAKFLSLREPLIFQDIDYCLDILKHPRLYLPFMGVRRTLLGAGVIALVLYVGVKAEPALTGQVRVEDFLMGLAALVVLGFALLGLSARYLPAAIFQPQADLRNLGLMAGLWRYAWAERAHCSARSPFAGTGQPVSSAAALSNLVVVQSESFFDVRQLYAKVHPGVLQHYDHIKASAACHGRLEVPAWGANTVRSEFSFLSAIAPASLGVHQFNPYRKFARQGFPTLAGFLKALGYRTVCVHPYAASFYNRDEVYPRLGFDEFIDIRRFDAARKSGPFIGDVALAETVCALLRGTTTQPIFVFVITMENHGPLHWEQVQPGDVEHFYSSPPPGSCDELTIYLRHLRNADRMAGLLRAGLEAAPHPAWLCWYGDHVPVMPQVYEALGAPDGKTDYLIWQKRGGHHREVPRDLKIEGLSRLLVEKMGLGEL